MLVRFDRYIVECVRKPVPNQNVSKQRPMAEPTAKPRSNKLNKDNRGRWLWLCFGLSGVAMLSATAGALLAVSLSSTPLMQSRLSAEDAAIFSNSDLARTNLKLPELTRSVNILIIGTSVLTSDLKDEKVPELGYHAPVNSLDGLSDVMLLVRFDPEANKLTVLSIPRDTRTLVEGYGVRKINDANYFGGPALSAKAVNELLGGVRIDRYIRINVQGVEKLVDALGGVKMYVPVDMKYQDDSQRLYINLKQGEQYLGGKEALQFLRFRYDQLGDIGRIQRQQMMMRSLMDQTLNINTITRLPKILSVVQEFIDTNLTIEEIAALAGFAAQTESSNVQMLMVPGDFSAPEEYEASYWLPNYERLDAMIAEHLDRDLHGRHYDSVDPAYVRVAIQDSTDDWDAVDRLRNSLSEKGYWNVFVSSPWNQPLAVTRIVAQNGDMESAQAIQQALGLGEVRVESTGSLRSDITIQIGRDWLAKQNLQNPAPSVQESSPGDSYYSEDSVEPAAADEYPSEPPVTEEYREWTPTDPSADSYADPSADPYADPSTDPYADPSADPYAAPTIPPEDRYWQSPSY
ncbi:LCP family protein [Laspinema sp. D3]|nr:LCP family protein [Laspinema sp. D2c]